MFTLKISFENAMQNQVFYSSWIATLTGFQGEVQPALHASQRWRQCSEEGIWCPSWLLRCSCRATNVCSEQARNHYLSLQQSVSAREACRWDTQTFASLIIQWCLLYTSTASLECRDLWTLYNGKTIVKFNLILLCIFWSLIMCKLEKSLSHIAITMRECIFIVRTAVESLWG